MLKKTKTILVIEEDDSLCVLLDRILGGHFVIQSFTDGIEALAWLIDGHETDLILVDLTMVHTSGLNLIENIKTSGIFKDIPVIALLDGHMAIEEHCLALGVSTCIPKPFNPQDLINFLTRILHDEKKIKTQNIISYAQHSL